MEQQIYELRPGLPMACARGCFLHCRRITGLDERICPVDGLGRICPVGRTGLDERLRPRTQPRAQMCSQETGSPGTSLLGSSPALVTDHPSDRPDP